jgi:uncharacterized membrane protein YesL
MFVPVTFVIQLYMSLQTAENLGIPNWKVSAVITGNLVLFTYLAFPMVGLVLVFGEGVANACSWCHILTKRVQESSADPSKGFSCA